MKIADLDRARGLAADLAATRRLRQRLADEPVRVTLGQGGDVAEIVISDSYRNTLTVDLNIALAARENLLAAELAALGVEP